MNDNLQSVSRVNELEGEVEMLQNQLQQVEEVSEQASARLAILLSREKVLMKEKRQLQHQIDRARIQMARNLGSVQLFFLSIHIAQEMHIAPNFIYV